MKIFSEKQFKQLTGRTGELIISIYTSTSKQSTDSYQMDKTHFKNKLKEVAKELETIHNWKRKLFISY